MDNSIRLPLQLKPTDVLGRGNSGLVLRLDATVKAAWSPRQHPYIEREQSVYERLGNEHKGILRYFGHIDHALILQHALHGSLRQYQSKHSIISLGLKLRWVEQIAAAIAFIHSKNVIHSDISSSNIFLDEALDIKIGDFAGSSIDGLQPYWWYEPNYELPSTNPGVPSPRHDLFALGSLFYEIITGYRPYDTLQDREISDAYRQGRFPCVDFLPALQSIINRCWKQEYASVKELLDDVQQEARLHPDRRKCEAPNSVSSTILKRFSSHLVSVAIPDRLHVTSPHTLAFVAILSSMALWVWAKRGPRR